MKTSFLLLAALLLPAELALSQHAGKALGRRARSFNSRGIRSLAHPLSRHTHGIHKPRHTRQSSRYIAQEHESQQTEQQQQQQQQQKLFEDIDEQQPTQQQYEPQHDTQQPEAVQQQQQQTMIDDLDLFQKPLEQVTQSPIQYNGYNENQVPTTVAPILQQQQISMSDASMSEEEELAQMQQNSINQDELFAPKGQSGSHYSSNYSGLGGARKGSPLSSYSGSNSGNRNGHQNGNVKMSGRESIYNSNDYNSGRETGNVGGSNSRNEDDIFANMNDPSMGDSIEMLRNAIKGEPSKDYPIFSEVPSDLSFKCSQQQYPGYYADTEARCQVFHICQEDGRHNAFLCPNGTIFSQRHFVCVWWHEFECDQAETFYSLNSELYKNTVNENVNEIGNNKNSYNSNSNTHRSGYDSSNTYSDNGEFVTNYGENNYGGSGDDYKNELFGKTSLSHTGNDYTSGQQKINDYSSTKGGSQKSDYSGLKNIQKSDYSSTKGGSQKNDYSSTKGGSHKSDYSGGIKTLQKSDYSGAIKSTSSKVDYSDMKNLVSKPNYSGLKTSQKIDYSGMKTAQQQIMNDYSGMKTAQQQIMNDYSGMKTILKQDYSDKKNIKSDYSAMKSTKSSDHSAKNNRISSPKENLNRMYVQQIDEFTTIPSISYSGKTNNNSPNYSSGQTKGITQKRQMFEPQQQQQELMNYDEPQSPVTDATPMMFTPQVLQQHSESHSSSMDDVFEETSTPDSLEAALGEEIHSEAPLIESMALTSSSMRISTPVPNNYSPYGASKNVPLQMTPSKTASPVKNFYAAQEQQKLNDESAFEKSNNYGYSGTKSSKPPKKGGASSSSSSSSSSMNELKSPMMMMRNYGSGSNKGYNPSSGSSSSQLKSPSAMVNKSYSPSSSPSYGVKQRK